MVEKENYKLYLGDCLEIMDKLMWNEWYKKLTSFDLVWK